MTNQEKELARLREELEKAKQGHEDQVHSLNRQIERIVAERDAARAECNEQARLNGMGSQREVRLMTERDAARFEARKAEESIAVLNTEIDRLRDLAHDGQTRAEKAEAELADAKRHQDMLMQQPRWKTEQDLRAELADAKKAAAPHVHEWALRLEDEVEQLTRAVADHVTVRGEYLARAEKAEAEVERLKSVNEGFYLDAKESLKKLAALEAEVERLKAELAANPHIAELCRATAKRYAADLEREQQVVRTLRAGWEATRFERDALEAALARKQEAMEGLCISEPTFQDERLDYVEVQVDAEGYKAFKAALTPEPK